MCIGIMYKQSEGGAIGARLTGVVARINMDRWEEEMLLSMRKMRIETYLFTKYVDDVNLATSVISEGWKWKEDEEGWRNDQG